MNANDGTLEKPVNDDGDDVLDRSIAALRDRVPPGRPPDDLRELTLRQLQIAISRPTRLFLPRRTIRLVRYGAAAIIVIAAAAWMFFPMPEGSADQAFAQVVERAKRFDSVRYSSISQNIVDGVAKTRLIDHRIVASGGRRRSDLDDGMDVRIHNLQTCPDADLALDKKHKVAEFTPMDKEREALFLDDPVDDLKAFASTGVRAAAGEIFQGKAVRVFVGDGSLQGARRILVDKASGLPVRFEIDQDLTPQGLGRARLILQDFEWNPTIEDTTFSTDVPSGYKVRYNAMKPLHFALDVYASHFDGRLPDQIDADALAALRRREKAWSDADGTKVNPMYDADWGFSIPEFAARHHLDFRYYGAGMRMSMKFPARFVAAIEIAPGTGIYDVLRSDESLERVERAHLP